MLASFIFPKAYNNYVSCLLYATCIDNIIHEFHSCSQNVNLSGVNILGIGQYYYERNQVSGYVHHFITIGY